MIVQAYLSFDGRCEEAVRFYCDALGAQVQHQSLYKDSPEALPEGMVPAGWEGKVMHVSFSVGGSTVMAWDSPQAGTFNGITLSIGVATEAEADRVFAALSAGGKVTMPLARTFWSPKFGMCNDRFGVPWMVNVDH